MKQNRLTKILAFLQETPGDPFLLFAAAREYASIGDIPEARAFFEKLRMLHPDYTGLYYHFGKLEEEAGRTERAIEIYTEGMKICMEQGDQHAFSELGGALSHLRES